MNIHYSDLLFTYLLSIDPQNITLTETPYGVKVLEWVYADDQMFIGIFSWDNQLICYHFE